MVQTAREFANNSHTYKSSEEYSILFRKEITSLIVDKLITDIGLIQKDGKNTIGYKTLGLLASGLKKLTFEAIKRNPDIIEYEYIGEKVIKSLYAIYMDKTFNRDMLLLPAEYREPENWERVVIDYIGGMMDIYAIAQYEKYHGNLTSKGIYNI